MVGSNYCFVPGCKTGYKSYRKACKIEGKKPYSLFRPPRDAALFELWKQSLPITDRPLTHMNTICELHFSEDDIERFFITKIKDGSIYKMERDKPKLKLGAVPKILTNNSNYSTRTVSEAQAPILNSESEIQVPIPKPASKTQLSTYQYLNENSLKMNHSAAEFCEVVLGREECINGTVLEENINVGLPNFKTEVFTFSTLLEEIYAIKLPCNLWGITKTANFVICVKWNSLYIPERRVIIENNLAFKIFLKEKRVCVPEIKEITSVNDISSLLEKVNRFRICAGAGDRTVEYCHGYLPDRTNIRGNYSYLCKYCKIIRKKRRDASRNRKKSQPLVAKRQLYQRIVCAERKNIRLRQKVTLLNAKLEATKKLNKGTSIKKTDGTVSNLSPCIITVSKTAAT